jgi:hypothetical protein
MRDQQTHLVHKLLAILLMAMLFYVQGVKLLHRHDYLPTKHPAEADQHTDAGQRINGAHSCPICDFHLAKDAELPQGMAPLQELSCQYITYPFRPSVPYPGMVSIHANKGPPVCIA